MAIQRAQNTYSPQWFAAFHRRIPDIRTRTEVEFICSVAPLPKFRRVADICCGRGRHARALAERGYVVTALDRDTNILAEARHLGGPARYLQMDLRDYSPNPAEYDAIAIMGQSFGHFDCDTNEAVLSRLSVGLRSQGRLILDLWAADFFHAHQGAYEFHLPEGTVHEMKRVEKDRLFVQLTYPGGDRENFEWQLFTPQMIEATAKRAGLRLIMSCTDFDSLAAPDPSKPRIQFVLERI